MLKYPINNSRMEMLIKIEAHTIKKWLTMKTLYIKTYEIKPKQFSEKKSRALIRNTSIGKQEAWKYKWP